jgi:hypothetical protein
MNDYPAERVLHDIFVLAQDMCREGIRVRLLMDFEPLDDDWQYLEVRFDDELDNRQHYTVMYRYDNFSELCAAFDSMQKTLFAVKKDEQEWTF